ncbi:zf-HC2 domain-containing protein [Streptomyces sp. NPDC093109]|uniref:zf-HC2 domain-containing protein n=1 Tax=Streptomyces sp. NPDC093109 TaxID=3154977 RepID=UPI00344DBA27
MTTHEQYGLGDESTVHEAVGAYVLGILDDAEATAFEAHLAGCRICAVHLEEFSGMEPMLAMLGDAPSSLGSPNLSSSFSGASVTPISPGVMSLAEIPTPSVSVQPTPQLLDRLVDEVAVKRAKRKRRGLYLVAAAAALIIAGPVGAIVATSGDSGGTSNQAQPPRDPAADFQSASGKLSATDPTTKVSASVSMAEKLWGTEAMLELKNVKGPLKCSLIVVSSTGAKETVTTWAVPEWGYGIPDSPNAAGKKPLYVQGGTSIPKNDIDHFEVVTLDGDKLVEIPA